MPRLAITLCLRLPDGGRYTNIIESENAGYRRGLAYLFLTSVLIAGRLAVSRNTISRYRCAPVEPRAYAELPRLSQTAQHEQPSAPQKPCASEVGKARPHALACACAWTLHAFAQPHAAAAAACCNGAPSRRVAPQPP
jgi:hypothetical protein